MTRRAIAPEAAGTTLLDLPSPAEGAASELPFAPPVLPASPANSILPAWLPARLRNLTLSQLLWTVAAVGAALRVHRYLVGRSLWLDEGYLSFSLVRYSFGELLTRPLAYTQAAPIGFLLLCKAAVTAFGTSEFALRLVPLLMGLASLPVFAAIARRLLPARAAVMAMVLFATLEPLLYYSAEVKQYSTDVTIALALVLLALRLREKPARVGRWLALAAGGGVSIFFSQPAVFSLASVGLVLAAGNLTALVRGPRRAGAWGLIALAAVGAVWLALFWENYLLFLKPVMGYGHLYAYWKDAFAPPGWIDGSAWVGASLYQLYFDYSSMCLVMVDTAMVATLVGAYLLGRRDRGAVGLLVLPLLLTLAAAFAHVYPFSGRLLLFLGPLLLLLIGLGLEEIWDAFGTGKKLIPSLLLLTVFGPTLAHALFMAVYPLGREEIKPLLAYVQEHQQPGDVLYVYSMTEPPFSYYKDRFQTAKAAYGLDRVRILIGRQKDDDGPAYVQELAGLRGSGRVWLLMTHCKLGEAEAILDGALGRGSNRLDVFHSEWGLLVLYDTGNGK